MHTARSKVSWRTQVGQHALMFTFEFALSGVLSCPDSLPANSAVYGTQPELICSSLNDDAYQTSTRTYLLLCRTRSTYHTIIGFHVFQLIIKQTSGYVCNLLLQVTIRTELRPVG